MPVFIGSTPNTTEDDLKVAEGILNGSINTAGSLEELKNIFQKEYCGKSMYFFNRGRDAMYFLFQNLGLKPNDEIVVQGFTCIAVVAPILWVECKPVFVDITRDTFNMDLEKLKSKITSKTRAVVIQHTFGNIVDMEKVREIVDRENEKRNDNEDIFVLEDCAHILDFDNKEIGKYSDAFFFSFAQDKPISSTQGACLIINNKRLVNGDIDEKYEKVPIPSEKEALYNAKYILLWEKIKKNYYKKLLHPRITVGKLLLLLYRFTGGIKKQASSDTTTFDGAHRMSEVQAKLLLTQLQFLKKFNENRKRISNIYGNEKVMLRYPVLLENPNEVRERLRNIGVISGVWYSTPVFPIEWDRLEDIGYKEGECPEVEFCCKRVINLPTNMKVDESKAKEIMNIVKKYAKLI